MSTEVLSKPEQIATLTSIALGLRSGLPLAEIFKRLESRNSFNHAPLWKRCAEEATDDQSVADLFKNSFADGVADILAFGSSALNPAMAYESASDYLKAIL